MFKVIFSSLKVKAVFKTRIKSENKSRIMSIHMVKMYNKIKKREKIVDTFRFQVMHGVTTFVIEKMVPETVKIDDSNIETFTLSDAPLENIAAILGKELRSNFQNVNVQVTECPDLTQPPFTLACKGLNGDPVIVDCGGVPYLLPTPNKRKLYDLRDVAKTVKLDPCYMIGAGAGPWPYAGTNCEMMVNMKIKGSEVENHTRIAKVDIENGKCVQEMLPDNECRNAILSNLYCSRGEAGKVLKVHCAKRIGNNDFITSIRHVLTENFKDIYLGLGGVFLIKEGSVKQHVMPDFPTRNIHSDEDLNKWLKFYEMSAPLIAVGTLINRDPDMDLRLQHFHSFSHHGEGGHYHYDTTPNEVEYLAYFGLGKKLYRIDRPPITHNYGRD